MVVVVVKAIRNGGKLSLEEEAGIQVQVLMVVVLEGTGFYPLRFRMNCVPQSLKEP